MSQHPARPRAAPLRTLAGTLPAVLCALLWLGAIAASPAAAKPPPLHIPKIQKPGDPASSEYQEDVPSAFGNVPVSSVPSQTPPPGGSLPASVSSALSSAGANGRAAAALAAAGIPQITTPTHRATGADAARHGAGHHGGRARRGAGGSSTGTGTGGASKATGAAAGGGGGLTPGSAPGAAAGKPSTGAAEVAQAGSGRTVLASLVRAVTGDDGGIGGLLPALLLASLAVAVLRIALTRREER